MTMALDTSQQQRFGPGTLSFDYQAHAQPPPAFSNPWSSSSSSSSSASPPQSLPAAAAAAVGASGGLFNVHGGPPPGNMPPTMIANKPLLPSDRASSGSISSMASYASLPMTSSAASQHQHHHTSAASLGTHHDLLNSGPDMMSIGRLQTSPGAAFGEAGYAASAASPVSGHFAPSTATGPYEAIGYAAAPARQHPFSIGPEDGSRRFSHTAIPPTEARRSFADALDASHGMLAMSQETPRNIYGTPTAARHERSSIDSYGFPLTHSTSSSISSNGNYSSYYGDSVSDYSTAGSDHESRTLPRSGLLGGTTPAAVAAAVSVAATTQLPPAPQSMMMSQFSSKVPSSTQKKHKCKICEKRFTRPSSLQTHMYSHTGEKPFICEVDGCGRKFSVVSNLRRHRKIHRSEDRSEAGSEDHHSE